MYCRLGPSEAEVKALEEAVDFAWDVGTRDVHFECYSKLIVDTVLSVSSPQVSIYNIIASICPNLQAFRTSQISYVKQTENQSAHVLAQHAKSIKNYVI